FPPRWLASRRGRCCLRWRLWPEEIGGISHHSAFYTDHGWQSIENLLPGRSLVGRAVELSASRTEVDSDRIERVSRHAVAQHSFVGSLLWQPAPQGLPRGASIARSINPQSTVACAAKLVRLNWDDIHAVRVLGVHD